MTILTSVRLRNWRGIRDITFKPLEKGLTGVSGANGAGKSTIQEGVLWALFGVTPDDAKKADLRRDNSAVTDECSVSVVFEHKGQTIEVIRQLTGKNHTTTMYVYVDGREQTHTTPTAATQWLVERLDMDAEGFLTAHVVKQKQLDSLITATPAERRTLIEKFFGIEKMSEALKAARGEANDAKKVAAALPGSEEDVEAAEAKVEEAANAVDVEQSNVSYVEQTLLRVETDLQRAEATLANLEQAQAAYSHAQLQVERAEHAVQVVKEKIASTRHLLDDARMRAEGGDEKSLARLTQEAQSLETDLAAARAQRDEFRSSKASAEAQIASLERRLGQIDETINRLQTDQEHASARLKGLPKPDKTDYSTKAEELDSALVDLTAQVRDFEGRQARLGKSIAALSEHADSANCPTCHTHLDDPAELIATFETEVDDLKARAVAAQEQITTVRLERQAVEQKAQEQQRAATERQNLSDALQRAKDALKTAQKERKEQAEELATAQSNLKTLIDGFDVDALSSKTQEIEARLSKIRVDLARQNEAKEAAQRALRLESEVQALQEKVEEAEYDAGLAEERLAAMTTPSVAEISEAEETVRQKKSAVNEKREALSAARGDLRAAQARVDAAKENLAAQKQLLERKRTALAEAEEKTAVAEVLDEFRRDRISRIAPELSEATTSLISSVTDGYYTEVTLDENFTPTLIRADGHPVPSQYLSGGEKSVVSLALRVAIGDIMTGGNAGLLWLDEVLVSQDAERRQAMMAAIRDLNRQVIVVNHTQGADDIVDTLVTVVKDDENGSYLAEE